MRKRDRAKEIEKKNFGKMANHEKEDSEDIDPSNLVGYLIKLLATRNPTVNIIRSITVLCLIYPQPNLKVLDAILPHLLSNLRKKSTRSKLSGFDSYHYSTLITTCLTRNYRELQTSTDVSKRTYYNLYDSGREIMEDVDCSSHTHADIASVFTRIKEHRRNVAQTLRPRSRRNRYS